MKLIPEHFLIYNIFLTMVSAIFLFLAYRKGFVRQLLDLASLIASYVLSGILCPYVAQSLPLYHVDTSIKLVDEITTSVINSVMWFVILIILFRIIYWILCFVTKNTIKIKTLSWLNRIFGLALGIIKVFMILSLFTVVLKLPLIENGDLFVQSGILSFVDKVLSNIW